MAFNFKHLTDSQKDDIIKEFIEFFGGKLPDPVNYPKSFGFYVKMFEMHLNKKNKENK